MNMNWLDILIICLAVIGILKGLFDGVIKQVVSLIALLVGIFFCSQAAGWLQGYIAGLNWFPEGSVTIVSYIVAFLLIVGIFILAGEIVHRIVGVTPLSLLNHVAGGLFGFVIVILFSSVILNVLEVVDPSSSLMSMETKVESRFYYPVKKIVPMIFTKGIFGWEYS